MMNTPFQAPDSVARLFNMDLGTKRIASAMNLGEDIPIQLNNMTGKPHNLLNGTATPTRGPMLNGL